MSTTELVKEIQMRANDPKRRSSGSHFDLERFRLDPRWSRTYPPVPIQEVQRTEAKLGFTLPALLARLYTEVGNGGFGPGYGLFGIKGGFTDDSQQLPLPELYLSSVHPQPGMLPHELWPEKLVPICDWGCNMMSSVDCSARGGTMVFLEDDMIVPEDLSFDQWMEDWVKGVDLFRRARRRR
jgi:hypothetical protein